MVNPDTLFGRMGNRMFQMAFIYAQICEGNVPDIYLQDYRLFEKYENEIKQWFGDGVGYLDYVAIHVRRGDYVNNPFYTDLFQTDYYEKAIELFPIDKFLVFSDEPEYCKEKWGHDERFQIMEKKDEVEDLNLMASCKAQIIANSSFSWWAAFLNPNPTKKVVYPSKWFTDNQERITFPPTWTKI